MVVEVDLTGDYWQHHVYAAPPLAHLDRIDASSMFEWLELHFPVESSKIAWSRVPSCHAHWKISDPSELAAATTREISRRAREASTIVHVGDSISPYGVRFSEATVSAVVAALLEIPEHHYFVAFDRSWLVAVSFEGDLDVVDPVRFSQ